jgi:hypothetical protein
MNETVRALLFGMLFLVTLGFVLWTVYDAQTREDAGGWKVLWWIVGATGAVLVLPALVINAFQLDASEQDLIDPLSYLGIAGTFVGILSTGGYFVTRDQEYQDFQTRTISIPDLPPMPMPMPMTEPLPVSDGFDSEAGKTMILKRPTARLASFWVTNGPRRGTQFPLTDVTNIGRSGQKNDIILADEAISGEHARVRFDDERKAFVFRDLDSTNGSYLVTQQGKEKIEAPHVLHDGDMIELGSTTLVYKEVSEVSVPS